MYRILHKSSTASFEMKYTPVAVLLVELVCKVLPNFNAPFSTTPPPGLGSLCRAFAPFNTVKFARLNDFGVSISLSGYNLSRATSLTSGVLPQHVLITYLISFGFLLTMVGIPK